MEWRGRNSASGGLAELFSINPSKVDGCLHFHIFLFVSSEKLLVSVPARVGQTQNGFFNDSQGGSFSLFVFTRWLQMISHS